MIAKGAKLANPFTLVFGKNPSSLIERPAETEEIVSVFQEEDYSQQIFLITGVRGYGKTVLMTDVARQITADKKWVHIELNPTKDLITSLLTKLNSNKTCLEIIKSAKINLSFFGFSVGFSGAVEIKDPEVAISEILKSFKKHNKRLLITIDEVTNSEQMRIFASTFQILVREDLPVFLIMTGLYNNIDDLQNADNLTFLYRAPKIHLGSLNLKAISAEYKRIFECSDSIAEEMAKLTRGYPYAFQLLGYLTWENEGEYKSILDKYEIYLSEYVYDKIWSELSSKDREICRGIARCGEGATSDIREKLGLTQNEFNPYRKRLLKKGIIKADERGSVRFTLPMFDRYCLES